MRYPWMQVLRWFFPIMPIRQTFTTSNLIVIRVSIDTRVEFLMFSEERSVEALILRLRP